MNANRTALRLPPYLHHDSKFGTFHYRGPNPDGGGRMFVAFGKVDIAEARRLWSEITKRIPPKAAKPRRSALNRDRRGIVYVVRAGDAGPFKVGFTAGEETLERRIADLQTGCPFPIQVVGFLPGSTDDEFRVHERLWQWRTAGEWFRPTVAVIIAVQNLLGRSDNS